MSNTTASAGAVPAPERAPVPPPAAAAPHRDAPLHGAQLAAFRAQTAPALAKMESVEKVMYADAEPAKSGSGKKG